MATMQKITSSLWFDNQAEDAAKFYISVFKNSKIGRIARYGKEGFEIHGRPEGSVMTVEFWIEDQGFVALTCKKHGNVGNICNHMQFFQHYILFHFLNK